MAGRPALPSTPAPLHPPLRSPYLPPASVDRAQQCIHRIRPLASVLFPQRSTLEIHPIVRGSGEKATPVDGSLPVCLLPSLPTLIHSLLAPCAASPPPTMTSNSSWVSNGASLETVSGKRSRMFPLCHIIYALHLKIG